MVYSALLAVCCPLAWSWLQWRRQVRAQALHQYVSKEYDHACLRSCRARALYEGLKVRRFVGSGNLGVQKNTFYRMKRWSEERKRYEGRRYGKEFGYPIVAEGW